MNKNNDQEQLNKDLQPSASDNNALATKPSEDSTNQDLSSKDEIVITKDMILGDIIAAHPDAAEVFLDYGLHCVGCFANAFDTVEMGAKIHMMGDDEIEEMVERVNEVLNYGE